MFLKERDRKDIDINTTQPLLHVSILTIIMTMGTWLWEETNELNILSPVDCLRQGQEV